MSPSKIEWTEETWNPVTGCTMISQGCKNCYAQALTKRYAGAKGWPAEFLPWTPANAAENVVLHPDRLEAPFSWKTPRRVFVNSMSDLFHENIPFAFVDQVFAVMALTPQHTYQVLTKRPDRMQLYLHQSEILQRAEDRVEAEVDRIAGERGWCSPGLDTWPLPNVWLGVTVENQRWADERIPILLDTPAAVRFVSAEPLLGPVDLAAGLWGQCPVHDGPGAMCNHRQCKDVQRLDWIIVGGESGPKHRPFDPAWARSIVAQCKDAGVACFVKQLGGARPGTELEDTKISGRKSSLPTAASAARSSHSFVSPRKS